MNYFEALFSHLRHMFVVLASWCGMWEWILPIDQSKLLIEHESFLSSNFRWLTRSGANDFHYIQRTRQQRKKKKQSKQSTQTTPSRLTDAFRLIVFGVAWKWLHNVFAIFKWKHNWHLAEGLMTSPVTPLKSFQIHLIGNQNDGSLKRQFGFPERFS